MPKAKYWLEKPNDSVHEAGGRIYTHRDRNGNPARLVKGDIRHYFVGSCVPRRVAKVWAVLLRANLSAESTAGGGADPLSKGQEEDWVITTHNDLLRLDDEFPEFVKGAVNKMEGPSERWAHVKVDTPMWVSTDLEADVFVALFSHAEGDTVFTFQQEESSGDNSGNLVVWKHVTIAPTECNL